MTLTTLNVVSDLATPHNNDLIESLRRNGRIRIITWYALRHLESLPWKEPLGGAVDNHYFDAFPNKLRLIFRALFPRGEEFLLVGYSNAPAKLILLAYWLLGRRLYFWSDYPEPVTSNGKLFGRRLAYFILKKTVKRLFVVGKCAERYFLGAGFAPDQLENLPICIKLPPMRENAEIRDVRLKYEVGPDAVLGVAASRLAFNKGYDILLRAVASLKPGNLAKLRLLIIGNGPEKSRLTELAHSLGLHKTVLFVPWLEPVDYERTLAAADFFVHPARFDAFGGGTLYAMGVGVPVIGSEGAGSAMERILTGSNGLLFAVGDERALAGRIEELMIDGELRGRLAAAARRTAEQWTPSRSAMILEDAVLGGGAR